MATTCSVHGCTKPARAAGQCTSHYQRARRLARGESAPELEQPLRDRDRPKVFARVARATKARIDAEAKARGIPPYRVVAEVLDAWAGANTPPLKLTGPSKLERELDENRLKVETLRGKPPRS